MIEFELWDTKFRVEDGKLYRLNKHTKEWTCCNNLTPNNKGYIPVKLRNKHGIYREFKIHRLIYYAHNQDWDIMDSSQENSIDHISREKEDNTIDNLREADAKQQCSNQTHKGYCFHKRDNAHQVSIQVNNKKKFMGYYKNEEDARLAYLLAKDKLHNTLLPTEEDEMNALLTTVDKDIYKRIDNYVSLDNKISI